MTALRFAPIIRVSTEKQKKRGESLRTQTTQIKAYVKALNGTIPDNLWKYAGQESATPDKERKLLDQLLQDSEKGLFECVIVCDPSRWSRDNLRSKEGLEVLRQNGIRFFVGSMEYDLFDPTQMFYLGMNAEIGEYTVSIGSLKSIQNRIERAKRGIPTTGKLPYGRVYDESTGKWSVDPVKQKIIQGAAERYINGENIKEIALSLGMVRSTLYQNLTEKAGPEWTVRFRYEKARIDETVKIHTAPLLDPITIQKIHDRVKLNTNSRRGNRKWFFLLSGFVFCNKCGYRFIVYKNPGGNRFYRHRVNELNKQCEVHKSIPAQELENAVLLQLLNTIGDPERVKQAIQRAQPDLEKVDQLTDEQVKLEQDLQKIIKQKDRVIDLVADGEISKEETRKKMTYLREQEQAVSDRLTAIRTELENIPDPERVKRAGKLSIGVARHIARDPKLIFKKDEQWKRNFIEQVFSGRDSAGKSLGIYVEYIGGKWQYEVRAAYDPTIKSLPLSDEDLIEYFKIDTEYQDVGKELRDVRSKLVSSDLSDLIYSTINTL